MAVEKDFELLDDYLSNRLSGGEKSAFEKKLEADPELKQEAQLQQDLVQGLRQARAAELKSMLNNVPVAPIQGGQTSMLVKVGSWVAITGIVATGVFFYFSDNETPEVVSETKDTPAVVEQPEVKDVTPEPNKTEPATEPAKEESAKATEPAEKKAVEVEKKTVVAPTESKKPALKVYDPSKETSAEDKAVEKYEREQLEIISKAFVTSSIEVETDNTNKKYTLHYVFKDGKLVLFGGFEKNLYEILEFISDDKRTVVLFYKTNYYLLDINKTTPTLLTPIRDKALLKKLHEYRK
jgi:hypothetical protein